MQTNAHPEDANVEDENKYLINVENTLRSTEQQLYKFVQDFSLSVVERETDYSLENKNSEKAKQNVPTVWLYPQTSLGNDSNDKEKNQKISALEQKCEELRAQVDCQMQEKKRIEEEVDRLKDQILSKSTYCASLGAILGNLTWCSSRYPDIVDIWLSVHKVAELLKIVNGSFASFVNTYTTALPPSGNVEYQFMIGLLGTVSNITANPKGREFLITNSDGKDFVYKIIKLMPALPASQASFPLKRLILMTLCNVSMNKTGLQYLFQAKVGDVVNYCLMENSLPEKTQLLCLNILQSITYDLTESEYIRDLITTISIDRLQNLTSSSNENISTAAKQIIEYFKNAEKYIG